MAMTNYISNALNEARGTLERFASSDKNQLILESMIKLLACALKNGNKAIIFGNGGSMCDAMHFAEELSGRFRKDRPALPALAISDPSHLTCVANDYGFDQVFARGVEAFAQPNDVVIGISTSGNSPNVINGLKVAQEMQCFSVGLLGKDGGKLAGECDYELIIEADTADRVQEVHGILIHIIIEGVERELYPELY